MNKPLAASVAAFAVLAIAPGLHAQPRKPSADESLREWLVNMVAHHRFTDEEVVQATGLTADEVAQARARWEIAPGKVPARTPDAPLLALPYPGGRHPRIGFLDGAVNPQRETKISVFPPWPDGGYVVADVPEAIWSNLGLTYLAHTHVPTIWEKDRISLDPLEWKRGDDGALVMERTLPNGIRFGTKVRAARDAVRMEQWLVNGTEKTLSGLRVQNCVMLKGARGFTAQSNVNKVLRAPFAACRDESGKRWVITAWSPIDRVWANPPCPCLHADPKFPDCPPGETHRLRGWLSFFEGDDIAGEFRRIEASGWDRPE